MMSEQEKMLKGMIYDASDKSLVEFRNMNGNPRLFNCRDENEPWLLRYNLTICDKNML